MADEEAAAVWSNKFFRRSLLRKDPLYFLIYGTRTRYEAASDDALAAAAAASVAASGRQQSNNNHAASAP